jgi:Phage tail protein
VPLAIGTGVVPTPPPGPAPPNAPPAFRDRPAAWWIDPSGTVWQLTTPDSGYYTTDGVKGIGAAPIALTADPAPRGGASVRHIQPGPRLITWPLYVWGDNHSDFLDRWRSLARAFTDTSRKGPGSLVIARPDGTQRVIDAYYSDGFDNSGSAGSAVRWDTAVLTLFCEDPYWRDPDPTRVLRAADTPVSFLSPFMTVSSGATLGDSTIDNPGEVDAWPTWTITGPASLIVATNNTTGESWTLDPTAASGDTLAGGDTVTLSTDPPAITGPDGSSWVGGINWPGAVLWPLISGTNEVTFAVSGSGASTAIEILFYPRYETA